MAAAIGGLAGVGLFCLCEILPYVERKLRRQSRRRASSSPRRKDNPVGVYQRCRTRAYVMFGGILGRQLEDLLSIEELANVIFVYLKTHELCLLRGACDKLRTSGWGLRLHSHFYIFGGECIEPNSVERLNLACGSMWESLEPMQTGRIWACGVAAGGLFYLCGGTHGQGALCSVDCFDPEFGLWREFPSMLTRRIWPCAFAVNGMLFVCGGKLGSESLQSAECFDFDIGEWESIDPMSTARHGASGVSVQGVLIVCGGLQSQDDLNSVEFYNTDLELWRETHSMLQERAFSTAAATKDHLYVCGGRRGSIILSSVERYDFELERWEQMPTLSITRYGAISAVMGGRVHVFGGRANSQTVLSTVEVFDPLCNEWKLGQSMLRARAWAVGAVMTPSLRFSYLET